LKIAASGELGDKPKSSVTNIFILCISIWSSKLNASNQILSNKKG
jgi:hypothetical protein